MSDRLAEIEKRLGVARDALRSDATAYPISMTRDAAEIFANLVDDAISALKAARDGAIEECAALVYELGTEAGAYGHRERVAAFDQAAKAITALKSPQEAG